MILTIEEKTLGFGLTLNQVILLNLTLSKKTTARVSKKLISLISDCEIQYLIENNYIVKDDSALIGYKPGPKISTLYSDEFDNLFELLLKLYPTSVLRPDGTTDYLQGNIKKCKDKFLQVLKDEPQVSEEIFEGLKKELEFRTSNGKLGYTKRLWTWLNTREWDNYLNLETLNNSSDYGTDIKW